MAIIGVVAAMTIPSLINKTNDAEYNSSLKKFYSMLSQAVMTLQSPDYNVDFTQYADPSTGPQGIITALCTIFSCPTTDTASNVLGTISGNCLNGYVDYKSTTCAYVDLVSGWAGAPCYAAILKNGMYIATTAFITSRSHFQLYVDINGKKGPNMWGKDLYQFEVTQTPSGVFKPIAAGAPDAVSSPSNWGNSSVCTAGSVKYNTSWTCTYLRLTDPSKMP